MLLRGVAHNFNNVLGGVLGAAEILERYVEQGERPRRALRIIRQGSESAAALTRKLSIFSGVGRAEDDLNMGELHEVLDAIILMHQSQVGDRVSLSLEVPTDLPQIGISLDKFIEVINHLLLNAIEAIPDSGNIVVAAKLSAAKDSVSVSIKDSGVGMSPETVQRVFEPFFTTKNLDTRNAIGIEGHGLGLWNVYNLIHACGGEISVQSKVGEGTNVSVLIPVIAGS
jgi:two-component system cell cycle sensor histidine kinase/response regulator CckA